MLYIFNQYHAELHTPLDVSWGALAAACCGSLVPSRRLHRPSPAGRGMPSKSPWSTPIPCRLCPCQLQVLRRFLSVLGSFDWERYALALQGPLPLAELHSPRGERAGRGQGAGEQGSSAGGVRSAGVVGLQSLCFTRGLPSILLPAVDLSAMPGGATPLLDDAFMQEVSWEDSPCSSWLCSLHAFTRLVVGRDASALSD